MAIGEEIFGHLYSEKSLIALGAEDQNGFEQYAEMDDVELSLCNKLNRIYVCPHRTVITRPSKQSCLFSLYNGNQEAAIKHCRLHLTTQADDMVMAISKDRFVSYTKNPTTYTINCYCNNTKISGLQLAGIQEFTVDEGCIAELPKFKVQPQSDLYYTLPPKAFQWTLPSLDWIQADMSVKDLSEAVKKLESLNGIPPIDPNQAAIITKLHQPFYHDKPRLITMTSVGVCILVVMLLCLCAYGRAWCCRHRLQSLQTPPPVYPPPVVYREVSKADEQFQNLLVGKAPGTE